jgi:hypothetical protein
MEEGQDLLDQHHQAPTHASAGMHTPQDPTFDSVDEQRHYDRTVRNSAERHQDHTTAQEAAEVKVDGVFLDTNTL